MTFATFQRALNSFLRRTPFRPFMVELMTGEKLIVKHPEAILIDHQLVYFRSPSRGNRLFDCLSVHQLMDIEE